MAGEEVVYALRIAIADGLKRAIADGIQGANRQMIAFAAGMNVGAKGDMEKVHKAVAADARIAVQGAYSANVEAVRATPAYARFNRRSGYLGRIVRRRDMVRGDAGGISFIKESTLDKEAAHWRRLNFGAGDASGAQPAPEPLRIFGETVAQLQLPYGPSPSFALPKGFFVGPSGSLVAPNSSFRGAGGSSAFFPNRRSPYRPAITAGIRGRHFLEAGIHEIAQQLPKRYADLLNEWIQAGGKKARAINKAVT